MPSRNIFRVPKGVLSRDYARPALNKEMLGELDFIETIDLLLSSQPSLQPSPVRARYALIHSVINNDLVVVMLVLAGWLATAR